MPKTVYYRLNYTTVGTNDEEAFKLTSSPEEPHIIKEIRIFKETNAGIMKINNMRENLATIDTGAATISNMLKHDIEVDLGTTETFQIQLKEVQAGTHATVIGVIVAEIQ